MASNGLIQKAKTGTCRMCQRVRKTDEYLKAVGEVRHGFATGHIWECFDVEDCEKRMVSKLNDPKIDGLKKAFIKIAKERGRYTEYKCFS